MTNLEHYKNDILSLYGHNYSDLTETISEFMKRLGIDKNKYNNNGDLTSVPTVLNWLCAEYVEPLLSYEEKQYLTAVIAPFKDDIDYITKASCVGDQYGVFYECINIVCKNGDCAKLPNFPKGTAYKGMIANHQYSLNDLYLKGKDLT